MTLIKWHGQACFEIEDESITLVTDPHNGQSIGIKVPDVKADIVLVSHNHSDHINGLKLVTKVDTSIIDKPGNYKVKGVKIKGITSYHDESYGKERGKNIIYSFKLKNLQICHLGDLGSILTENQIKEIGIVDVLLIPVGGFYTINGDVATTVMNQLNPPITIPMHYSIKGLTLPIKSVKPFLNDKKNIMYIKRADINITKKDLSNESKIVVLNL
jgi:L-ascorbate metabolism protein UlaG (beta-lactamase superfamily)